MTLQSADIFLSYAHEDRAFARILVHKLQLAGWSVWWDRNITTGLAYDREIEAQIANARCVVVVWSQSSTTSESVRVEASVARERQVLVPVRIGDATPPLAFQLRQTIDFSQWRGEETQEWQMLVRDLRAILEGRNESPLENETMVRRSSLVSTANLLASCAVAACGFWLSWYVVMFPAREHWGSLSLSIAGAIGGLSVGLALGAIGVLSSLYHVLVLAGLWAAVLPTSLVLANVAGPPTGVAALFVGTVLMAGSVGLALWRGRKADNRIVYATSLGWIVAYTLLWLLADYSNLDGSAPALQSAVLSTAGLVGIVLSLGVFRNAWKGDFTPLDKERVPLVVVSQVIGASVLGLCGWFAARAMASELGFYYRIWPSIDAYSPSSFRFLRPGYSALIQSAVSALVLLRLGRIGTPLEGVLMAIPMGAAALAMPIVGEMAWAVTLLGAVAPLGIAPAMATAGASWRDAWAHAAVWSSVMAVSLLVPFLNLEIGVPWQLRDAITTSICGFVGAIVTIALRPEKVSAGAQ